MDLGLKGKTALVTGSTAGIGFAIAKALANEGAIVYINGRTKERVNEAIKNIGKTSGKLLAAPFDLSEKKETEALLKEIPKLDILVNNLGIYEVKLFEEITDEDWIRIFNINVLSGIRLSRYYFPKMKAQNWGRVVFISSESGVNIPVEMIHYGMTKTAQISIARGLAELTSGTAVTVNSVLVGPTYSEGVEQFIKEMANSQKVHPKKIEEDFFKSVRPSSLLKRYSTPDEIGDVVTFICSERASSINGDSLRAEGGVIRSII